MTRILLIEDSPTQAAKIRILLESAGFEVEVASDGPEGLEQFRTDHFELVLSDIVMPTLSGYDVCRAIKTESSDRSVPVVLLTMLDDPLDILQALQSGADSFITKPHADETLIPRIQNLLATRASRQDGHRDGVVVKFMDREFNVAPNVEQVLDLLVSTFEDNVRTNRALEESLQKLAVQNETLRRAERLKQELSALLVHDLKSPSSGLSMMAQMQLRKTDQSSADRARWRTVYETAEMLQRMVMNLLDISRSEDGALDPHRVDVDVDGLVEEVRAALVFQLEERGQSLEVSIPSTVRTITVDRELIRRLLLNLLDNASRHAEHGGRITVTAAETERGSVCLRVANTGSRIPPELRERVFEKYVRLDPHANAEIEPGRGLGLAFCRTAVEAHGGRIWVEDEGSDGTAFCIELPR